MFRGKTARCPVCKAVQIIPMDAKSGPSTGDTDSIENPILTRSFSQPGEAKRTPLRWLSGHAPRPGKR
jgi:hypothetical protein